MRIFLVLLCLLLPFGGNATVLASANVEANTSISSYSFRDSGRSNTRTGSKMIWKIVQRRLQKATRAPHLEYHDDGKGLILTGLATGVLGAVLLLLGYNMEVLGLIIAAVLLSLAGLFLCQRGLDHANAMDSPKRWAKIAAYAGLGLNLLVFLVSGGLAFLVLFFGKKG